MIITERGFKKMKKIYLGAVLSIALLLVMSSFVIAGKPTPSADNGLEKGKSDVSHLYLFEKTPVDTWPIVEGGAWGKLTFDGDSFVFNGKGLEAGADYTLIYYGNENGNNEWPFATCLATGTANNGGNINLAEEKIVPTTEGETKDKKIWLVLSDDVDCDAEAMIGWQPLEYLFEYNVI